MVALLDPRISPIPPAGKKRSGYVKGVLMAAGVKGWTNDLKKVIEWSREG